MVSARVAVLGAILGLLIGAGAASGFYYSQLGGTGGRTATETRTSQVISTLTSTVTADPRAGTPTVTVTVGPSRLPTMDIQATQLLYRGGSSITLFGTIYPPPSSTQGIVVTTKNPKNLVVDVGQAQVATLTGSFSYVIGASGTQTWTSGAYNVSATSGGRTVSTIFYFDTSLFGQPSPSLILNVLAPPLVKQGEQVNIAILTTQPNGAPDNITSWSTLSVLFPDGVFHVLCGPGSAPDSCTGTFASIQPGFYQVILPTSSTTEQGTYFVEAAVSDSAGASARALGQFVVQ